MAVSNKLYHETEDLVLAHPRRRYRTSIRWQHWQLRSLIGIDGQNAVYSPVPGPDGRTCYVQRLNTKTRETETVKRLSFVPRCLVACNGWVCCGGEMGVFSAFRVGEESAADDADRRLGLQADDRLPLDLSEANTSFLAQARSEKNLVAQSYTFGKDRVNCITLWSPPTLVEPFEGAYDQEVAVLAHNDSSVLLVSLRNQEVIDKITYPDYMNRGVVSPDGRLLIAISDDPYLYVHERSAKTPETGPNYRAAGRPTYEWSPRGRIQLKSQSKDDRSDNRGSFAACFSSTGRYLAVGTQYGTISVFDATVLGVPGTDSLLTTFNTSRSHAEFGAVRDMAFAPGPVDLLAWTEDRGRVGVADIRAGFDSRQILHIDQDSDFEHLGVADRSTIDPRLLEQRGDRGESLLLNFANALDPSSETRHNRHADGRGPMARYNIPLTAEETAVLEAIQDFRRRQDHYNAGPASNRTGTDNGGGGGSGSSAAARGAPTRTTEGNRTRERTASASRAVNEMLDNIRDQRERIRDTQERLRAREDSSAERRRYAASPFSGSTTTALAGTAGTGTSGRGSLISRLVSNANHPPSSGSGWDNLEALYEPSTAPGGAQQPRDAVAPTIFDFRGFADQMRRSSRAAYLMRDWEENPTRRVFGTFAATHSRPGPYDTAGLAWSENGDTLFVGAENGVYEFHVNQFGRRFSASITLS